MATVLTKVVDEARWQRARLLPTSGINGSDEEERRGASVFLAVLRAVDEYGRAITSRFGAPVGHIETYVECEFPKEGKTWRPDGVIRVRGKGGKLWTCLVEFKTRNTPISVAQVEAYLSIAAEKNYAAVVTVSSELSSITGQPPFQVDRKKLKKVALFHISWSEIHTEALIERANNGISRPDQAHLLDEFIRYMEAPKSGISDFNDMGAAWVATREAAVRSQLRAEDPAVVEVVDRIGQLFAYSGMRLSRKLGVAVRPVLSHNEQAHPEAWLQAQTREFAVSARVSASLQVPNAVNPINLTADLRSGRIECSVEVLAPSNPWPRTRVRWLLRQLGEPPKDLVIRTRLPYARTVAPSHTAEKVLIDPNILISSPKDDIRSFTLTLNRPAGTKRTVGRGAFIDSVWQLLDEFYTSVVANLKSPTPVAPKSKVDGKGVQKPELLSLSDLASPTGDASSEPSDNASTPSVEEVVLPEPADPAPEGD